MNGTVLSLTGFLVLLLAGLVLQVCGRRDPRAVPAGPALAAAMRTAPGRVAVLAGWMWLGVHFLAR